MTRELQGCGTDAAYRRHRKAAEEACDACKAAHRTYQNRRNKRVRANYPIKACTACDRRRHLGVGWCGTWCPRCLTQWIADGQPAPAETGHLGHTYRLRHDGLMSA